MAGHLLELSQEEFVHKSLIDREWRTFTVDSRQVTSGAVFFALPGERTDGHRYITQAMEAGARAVVLRKSWFESREEDLLAAAENNEVVLVPVDDGLGCLQQVGAAILKQSAVKKIGITGSNGKTSTKDLLSKTLSAQYSVHYAKGNLNSDIGLPIVLARIPDSTDYVVLEMAMSEAGEMKTLADLVLPDYALLTNIGSAHIGNLGSVEAIAEEKFQIFSNMNQHNLAVIPETDQNAMKYLERAPLKCEVLFYGLSQEFGFDLLLEDDDASLFTYMGHEYRLPLWGRHQLHNATGVITLAGALGLSPGQINEGFASFSLPEGRGNILRGESILMDDSYNASPDSMKAAFEAARNLAGREGRELVFILGDMKELGALSPAAHDEVLAAALGHGPRNIAVLGNDFSAAVQRLSPEQRGGVHDFLHFDDLKTWVRAEACAGMVFLVKASRSMELERIIQSLPGLMEKADV